MPASSPPDIAARAPNIFAAAGADYRISLTSGAIYNLPEGYVELFDVGPFLTLQRWNAPRQAWLTLRASGLNSYATFYSTGASHRVVNFVNCPCYATITNGGSGYSPSNPPLITSNSSGYANGKSTPATFRAIVGGAIQLTVVSGGIYDYIPTLVIRGYDQQTQPYRQAQINPRLNSSGAITGFNYDGNYSPNASGSTSGFSGAGLDNPGLLSIQVIRHPSDTQTSDASITISSAGSGVVTDILPISHGNPIGDRDVTASITHNGGSGLAISLGVNHYITSCTIADPGIYLNTYSDRGSSSGSNTSTTLNDTSKSWAVNQWAGYYVRILEGPAAGFCGLISSNTATALTITQKHPVSQAAWAITPSAVAYEIAQGVTSSTANDSYLGIVICGGVLDDEQARPTVIAGGIITLTNGVVTTAKVSGGGPFFSTRPKLAVAPSGGVLSIVRNASIVPVMGKGGDYFSYHVWPQVAVRGY